MLASDKQLTVGIGPDYLSQARSHTSLPSSPAPPRFQATNQHSSHQTGESQRYTMVLEILWKQIKQTLQLLLLQGSLEATLEEILTLLKWDPPQLVQDLNGILDKSQ